jgi:hypothetical protein
MIESIAKYYDLILPKYLTNFSKASYTVSVVLVNSSIMELQCRSLRLEISPEKNEVGHLNVSVFRGVQTTRDGHLDLSVAEFLAGIRTTRLTT